MSAEFTAINECTERLETALKGLDRKLIHFLHQQGFLIDDKRDEILKPGSPLTEAEKAGELVKWIKHGIEQDQQRYHTLVGWLKKQKHYVPIVDKLDKVYKQQHEQACVTSSPSLLSQQQLNCGELIAGDAMS